MIAVLWLGCGGGDGQTEGSPTYHHDVRPILEARCLGCHVSGGIGTFPLDGYDQVVQVGEIVAADVESRLMPPWKAVPGPAYANDPSLTDAQIATIRAWVDAGMPEGDPADVGPALPDLRRPLPRVDATLALPEPYSPQLDPDDYRCFPLRWDGAGTTWVTGFEVHPGNGTTVHHVAAFLVTPDTIAGPEVVDTFLQWDDDEPGPGYTCFGGPTRTGESLDVPVEQVAQWIPGQGATLFPEGVGIRVPEGSVVVLQMHYNTLGWDGAPDATTIDFATAEDVDRVGAFAPWLDALWTFGGMIVPAGQQATYVAQGDPLGFYSFLLGDAIDLSGGFTIHAGMMHMHGLGVATEVHVDHADGARSDLVAIDDWDFDWQLTYELAEPVEFAPGDELYLSCTFDNPTEQAVGWGEGTTEEMCVANLFVSAPK